MTAHRLSTEISSTPPTPAHALHRAGERHHHSAGHSVPRTTTPSVHPAGFSHFSLDPSLAEGLHSARFTTPTPIQERAIPVAMEGHDILGLAQTGTGKTAAFALPILHRLITIAARPPQSRAPRALVLAPTRELADQIAATFKLLAGPRGPRCTTIYGGVSMNPQIDALRRGVGIVVGCPGRVLDHMQQRTIDLSALEVLVLDEADHMFDMGFLPTVRRILGRLPVEKQTMMFSATLPPEIKALTADVLRSPVEVKVQSDRPVETVSHFLYPVATAQKRDLLVSLLAKLSTESVLIFTRTKHGAKKIAELLERSGHAVTCLQGNLSQNRRQEALAGFRSGEHRIMVATDIAARGIDVASVSHVINFDMPATVEAYTHRIGRTGRASRVGDAISFMTSDDRGLVHRIERVLGESIERRQLEGFAYEEVGPGDHSVGERRSSSEHGRHRHMNSRGSRSQKPHRREREIGDSRSARSDSSRRGGQRRSPQGQTERTSRNHSRGTSRW